LQDENNSREFDTFIKELGSALEQSADDTERLAHAECLVQKLLRTLSWLPQEKREPCGEHYARHSLYHDPENRFEILVLVWKPGQSTPLHDHDGTWGVEAVLQGRMKIINYLNLNPTEGGIVQLVPTGEFTVSQHSIGRLLHPADCHIMRAEGDEVVLTLHVYGKQIRKFRTFYPMDKENSYRVRESQVDSEG
jgi:3-mercaptopropionate dioxygenase